MYRVIKLLVPTTCSFLKKNLTYLFKVRVKYNVTENKMKLIFIDKDKYLTIDRKLT